MSERSPTDTALEVQELSVAIAHVAGRGHATLAERVRQTLGAPLPEGARCTHAGALRLLGISPGRWWAVREPADYDFAADLASLLRPAATVCDLSDAYAVLRLRGASVRPVLARLVAIDLHPLAFTAGQVAATVAAHMPVTFWRLTGEQGGAFELAVPRSYAAAWREVFEETAAGVLAAAEPVGG